MLEKKKATALLTCEQRSRTPWSVLYFVVIVVSSLLAGYIFIILGDLQKR